MNANVEQGTVKELLTLFTQEGAATCKATMLLTPGWSEGPGGLRPLVGSKGAVGKGVLTIASFADMTIPTLTQRPLKGTIVPGSTILKGFEGARGWEVRGG